MKDFFRNFVNGLASIFDISGPSFTPLPSNRESVEADVSAVFRDMRTVYGRIAPSHKKRQ